MKYWREEPDGNKLIDLSIKPGPKRLVQVLVLVDTADENEATDLIGEMMRGQEHRLTDGPIVDWAFGRTECYELPEEYTEGAAFKTTANETTLTSDQAFWFRYYVARLTAATQDTENMPPVELRRWLDEVLPDLDALVSELPLSPEQQTLAEELAAAMQGYLFRGGPDPETIAKFQPFYPSTHTDPPWRVPDMEKTK